MSIDLAFLLPYEKDRFEIQSKKENVGINISGLLWEGGFTRNNQFQLTLEYQKFIENIIRYFQKKTDVEIYIIPHVIDMSPKAYDDDYIISRRIARRYNVNIAPPFKNPIEAKSYISRMDFFIGSRMHSTVAAYSSGVPVVPVSYSRKFEGLYESLNYGMFTWTSIKESIEVQYLDILFRYGLIGLFTEVSLMLRALYLAFKKEAASWEMNLSFNKTVFCVLFAYYIQLFSVNQTSDRNLFYILVILLLIYRAFGRDILEMMEIYHGWRSTPFLCRHKKAKEKLPKGSSKIVWITD